MTEPKYTYTPQRLWGDSEGPSQWIGDETFETPEEAELFCDVNFDRTMNIRILRRKVEP